MLVFALALLPLAIQQSDANTTDVTVTGRKLPIKPIVDAIGYFERHCFDASRSTGAPSMPRQDSHWQPLALAERAALFAVVKDDPAYRRRLDPAQSLVLTASQATPHVGLVEHRCTLVVFGGDHARFADRIAAMFGGPGTRRHVGERDGSPSKVGWRQLLWTAIPSIGNQRWRAWTSGRNGDGWVKIVEWFFYDEFEYVVADFRTRTAGPALTVVTLIYTRRSRREP